MRFISTNSELIRETRDNQSIADRSRNDAITSQSAAFKVNKKRGRVLLRPLSLPLEGPVAPGPSLGLGGFERWSEAWRGRPRQTGCGRPAYCANEPDVASLRRDGAAIRPWLSMPSSNSGSLAIFTAIRRAAVGFNARDTRS
jgi:hypothetical protein